jgi:hypothetical protein
MEHGSRLRTAASYTPSLPGRLDPGSSQGYNAKARDRAKMSFVFRPDENAELEVGRCSCYGEIVGRNHPPAAAERREELSPTLSNRDIEVDDARYFNQ